MVMLRRTIGRQQKPTTTVLYLNRTESSLEYVKMEKYPAYMSAPEQNPGLSMEKNFESRKWIRLLPDCPFLRFAPNSILPMLNISKKRNVPPGAGGNVCITNSRAACLR